jgi:hypothetical protein
MRWLSIRLSTLIIPKRSERSERSAGLVVWFSIMRQKKNENVLNNDFFSRQSWQLDCSGFFQYLRKFPAWRLPPILELWHFFWRLPSAKTETWKNRRNGHRFSSFWSHFVDKKILRCVVYFILHENEIWTFDSGSKSVFLPFFAFFGKMHVVPPPQTTGLFFFR